MKQKNLIFTIEIGARELISKCLLALHCRQKGFRIYIGSFSGIDLLRGHLNSSILFHKGTWTKNVTRNQRDFGATNVFLDEEMGPTIPRDFLESMCEWRFREVDSTRYKKIFVLGDRYHEIMKKYNNMESIDIHKTGWPRIDLWRPSFMEMFRTSADEIRRVYGDYVLFPTTFGNTSEQGFQESIELFKVAKTDSMQTLRRNAFYDHLEMLPKLARALPSSMQLIVRPHPAEDESHWKELLRNCENIRIVKEGEVTPWLLAARAVLSFGSTTALQAAFNGIPVISYRVPRDEPAVNSLAFDVATHVDTVDGLLQAMLNVDKLSEKETRQKAIDLVKNDIEALEGPLASERIASVLDGMDGIEATYAPKVAQSAQYSYDLKYHARRFSFWMKRKRHGLTLDMKRRQFHKLPGGLDAAEIEQTIRSLGDICGIDVRDLKCQQLGKGLVLIE